MRWLQRVWPTAGNLWPNTKGASSIGYFAASSRHCHVVTCSVPPVTVPDKPFPEIILDRTKLWPDKTAFVDNGSNQSYTYSDVERIARTLARGLHSRGVRQYDTACIMAPNCFEFLSSFLGVTSLGGIITGVNPTYTSEEVANQLSDSGSSYLITPAAFLPKVDEISKIYTKLKEVYVIGSAPGYQSITSMMTEDNSTYELPKVSINPREDVVLLPYSSGTTGKPKGTRITHRSIAAAVLQTGPEGVELYREGKDVVMMTLPFFHIGGFESVLMKGLSMGSKLICYPTFNFENFLQGIHDHKATVLTLPPPILVMLAKDPRAAQYDLSSMETVMVGAAPASPAIIKEILNKYNIKDIVNAYGMTELSGVSHITFRGNVESAIAGSVGQTLPNLRCRIADLESGSSLPSGETGELQVKGDPVMAGYLNRPDATAETFTEDGWLRTGDIAKFDAEGNLYIIDRLKEFIKYKGFQVAPAELEDILLSHSAVAEAGVVGVPDELAGELPRGYVVLKSGQSLTEEELSDFVAEKVAPYKKLRGGIKFVDSVPKNASGKLLRRLLKEQAMKEK